MELKQVSFQSRHPNIFREDLNSLNPLYHLKDSFSYVLYLPKAEGMIIAET